MTVVGIHHVQVTVPRERENEALAFYRDFLGLATVEKPASQRDRGGFWLQAGDRHVHVGVEEGVNRAATKAHIAYEVSNLRVWREKLGGHGVVLTESTPIPGYDRVEFRDPFGNFIELIQPIST
jgi:catechol 2,3-dioxygenase-like lactoylglutathione lyase family enzyme